MVYDAASPGVARVVIEVDASDAVQREVKLLDGVIMLRVGSKGGTQLIIKSASPQWCYAAARALELGGDELRHAQIQNERRNRS